MEDSPIEEMKQETAEPNDMMTGKTAVEALGELMRFPFQDADWRKKFGIGSLLIFLNFIIPIVPSLAVAGYAIKVMRQAVLGQKPSLPEWDDWGDLIVEGLKAVGLSLIYLMPGYILLIAGYFLLFFTQLLALPISAAAGASGDPEAAAAGLLATLGVSIGTLILMLVVMGLGFLVLMVGALLLPLAVGNYLYEDDFSAGLRVRELWGYFKINKSGFVAAWVIYFGLAYLISIPTLLLYFTVILICLLPIVIAPFAFYMYLTGATSFGQYYRETKMIWEEKATV